MGRVCQICCHQRPNEQFGGKGHAASVCKRCRKRPKAEQQRILATNEILGFLLEQKNISAKNIKRLDALATIDDQEFQTLRLLILEIAHVKPHKRRRWSVLRTQHPALFQRAVDAQLAWDPDIDEPLEFESERNESESNQTWRPHLSKTRAQPTTSNRPERPGNSSHTQGGYTDDQIPF